MISGAMTSGVIANSIVNLCGAIGLGVAMFALHRRDPRSPLTQRLLVMLGIAAMLFFTRGVAWWTGSAWLDRLSLIPAAAVPLGALIVTEGILRRHAPKAVKTVALAGAVLFGLGGVFGFESYPHPIRSRCRCFNSRDLRLVHGCWRRGTAARFWPPRTVPSGGWWPARSW